MKVFKFGGASIKDAKSVRNMSGIIAEYAKEKLVVVVSAMGKTTNHLEHLLSLKLDHLDYEGALGELFQYHRTITEELFGNNSGEIIDRIRELFEELRALLSEPDEWQNPDMLYDAVISYGELLSSTIIAAYMGSNGYRMQWLDARTVIRTDQTFREGNIDWEVTCKLIQQQVGDQLSGTNFITQGFIGSTAGHQTTTLGREGSDFTAAIFGACLGAESVTIWKDVPGILNADPKRFDNTELYGNLSYQEAAEMTYYGASVIHPKTIKPLANKGIPLYVRSFEDPRHGGTVIDKGGIHKLPPTFVVKENQCLVSFGVKDLSFINEKNLSIIFHILAQLNIKINMMQNSAVSLTVCFDHREPRLSELLKLLGNDFKIRYNTGLQLFTIKNYTEQAIDMVSQDKEVIVEQRTRNTYQIVVH